MHFYWFYFLSNIYVLVFFKPLTNQQKIIYSLWAYTMNAVFIDFVLCRVIYDRVRNRKNYFEILLWTRKTKNGKIQSKRYTHWRLGNVYSSFWFSLSWRSLFEIQKRRQFENILPVISLEIGRHFSKILQ